MGTDYTHHCPKQSYAISLPMCLARQLRGDNRCRRCKNRPAKSDAPDAAGDFTAVAERVAA